jgi:hypothetical protein
MGNERAIELPLISNSRVTPGGAAFRNIVSVWLALYVVEVGLWTMNERMMGLT